MKVSLFLGLLMIGEAVNARFLGKVADTMIKTSIEGINTAVDVAKMVGDGIGDAIKTAVDQPTDGAVLAVQGTHEFGTKVGKGIVEASNAGLDVVKDVGKDIAETGRKDITSLAETAIKTSLKGINTAVNVAKKVGDGIGEAIKTAVDPPRDGIAVAVQGTHDFGTKVGKGVVETSKIGLEVVKDVGKDITETGGNVITLLTKASLKAVVLFNELLG